MITLYLAQPQLVTNFLITANDHPVLDTNLLLMTTFIITVWYTSHTQLIKSLPSGLSYKGVFVGYVGQEDVRDVKFVGVCDVGEQGAGDGVDDAL